MDDLEAKVKQIILKTLKKKVTLGSRDTLLDMGISSLKMVLILGQIENMLDIDIPQEYLVAENFKDVETICRTIGKIQQYAS